MVLNINISKIVDREAASSHTCQTGATTAFFTFEMAVSIEAVRMAQKRAMPRERKESKVITFRAMNVFVCYQYMTKKDRIDCSNSTFLNIITERFLAIAKATKGC